MKTEAGYVKNRKTNEYQKVGTVPKTAAVVKTGPEAP